MPFRYGDHALVHGVGEGGERFGLGMSAGAAGVYLAAFSAAGGFLGDLALIITVYLGDGFAAIGADAAVVIFGGCPSGNAMVVGLGQGLFGSDRRNGEQQDNCSDQQAADGHSFYHIYTSRVGKK